LKDLKKINKMKLKLAVKWEVKVEGDERSIQLYDAEDNPLKGEEAMWEGDFDAFNKRLTSLEGAPRVVSGDFDCSNNPLTSFKGVPKRI
jgi:hypothetical protein